MTDENMKKKVDDDWKQKAEADKQKLAEESKTAGPQGKLPDEAAELPKPDFTMYISSLSAQVLISLGQIDNPISQKVEIDLPMARYLIDLLLLLKEKTKGNLTKDEDDNFNNIIHGLQLLYVRVSKDKPQI
jgi:hypothetical protein